MTAKTEGVKILVQDVLAARLAEPYTEGIILAVFDKIDKNSEWKRRYDTLKNDLSKDVVNNWIGKYTKELTGLKSLGSAKAPEDSLITAYTRLG